MSHRGWEGPGSGTIVSIDPSLKATVPSDVPRWGELHFPLGEGVVPVSGLENVTEVGPRVGVVQGAEGNGGKAGH